MKQILFCVTLLLSVTCYAQQQEQSPPDTQRSPYTDPPTAPAQPQMPGQGPSSPLPPDAQAPSQQAMSTALVQELVSSRLNADPALARTNVDAQVSDIAIVLTGKVTSNEEHDLAVEIAESYGGDRQIIDKIKVQQKT